MVKDQNTIQMWEWSHKSVDLTSNQKHNINETVLAWQKANDLPQPPLWFSGTDGDTLNTREYVGVVELSDIVIEVYPKLDKHLLEQEGVSEKEALKDKENVGSVMKDLLWILDVSGHLGVSEFGQAGLEVESPTNFYGVFALLMAKNLLTQLGVGVPHKYIAISDDIRKVRGKIRMLDQITRNMNRLDLISCEWDEFTPDIPMNQLLKCSCQFLQPRVRNGNTFKALADCITQFDEICDVDPLTALTGVISHRWDRTTERFRTVFDLAKRLLQGIGHLLNSADVTTFVFLLDMNKVFQEYVRVLLEVCFDVRIESDQPVGYLFPNLLKGRVEQRPDYFWRTSDGMFWVGDAKYKHLTKEQKSPLMFAISEKDNDSSTLAGKILQPNDIRQLTVYAELIWKNNYVAHRPNILLLYPFVEDGELNSSKTKAWNGSTFTLCPVRMRMQPKLEDALPKNIIT